MPSVGAYVRVPELSRSRSHFCDQRHDLVPLLAVNCTLNVMAEQVGTTPDALAKPVFTGVYKQRRTAAQLGEQQALANQEFMVALEQIREETERTADRASKRTAGDWF